MNWQDRRNPLAGGAEVHLHEIFGRLAAGGHGISALVSGWDGGAARETVDGIDVHRAGGRYTFPLRVRGAYRKRLAGTGFDVVVEDINKLPLFTPLWIREAPVVALVPHLFGATAFREERWPVAAAVWAAERFVPAAYRRVRFQAISRSTARDLEARGIDRERIRVIEPGVDHDVYRPVSGRPRFPEPVAVYVGRLKRYKGLEVIPRAVRILADRGSPVRAVVAGKGDDRSRLEREVERLGVADLVTFEGFVTEERKVELLRRAWVNLYPSPKEGWGLTSVESAACGTPTVASDAPGLRESVADGQSGYLVPHGDPRSWADRIGRICSDGRLRRRLFEGCVRHAARFSWERAARETEEDLSRAADGAA